MAESVDFNAMTRNDLNAYATEHGIEGPETYATKTELIAAIKEAEAAAGEPPDGDEPPPEGGEPPPEEGTEGEGEEAAEPLAYAPISPSDDEENAVGVEVPKTDEEVAEEGTALAAAEAKATGGVVPFLSAEKPKNTRIWAMDAAHNTNDREEGRRGFERPDYVEHAS